MNNTIFFFPAGKYLVCDVCYVHPRVSWSNFVDDLYHYGDDGASYGTIKESNEIKYFVINTAWGDGDYPIYEKGQEIGRLSVDAGLLSIIPEKLVTIWQSIEKRYEDISRLGVWIEMAAPFEIEVIREGDFKFGDYSVNTSGEGEADSEEDEDNDYFDVGDDEEELEDEEVS